MWLPNGDRAIIDLRKLRDYCLNIEHPRGQYKARVFKRALGWTAADADRLQQRLLIAVQTEEAIFLGADDYGQRYALDFHVQQTDGSASTELVDCSPWRELSTIRFTLCTVRMDVANEPGNPGT